MKYLKDDIKDKERQKEIFIYVLFTVNTRQSINYLTQIIEVKIYLWQIGWLVTREVAIFISAAPFKINIVKLPKISFK